MGICALVPGDVAVCPQHTAPATVSGFQPEPWRQRVFPGSRPCCHPDSQAGALDKTTAGTVAANTRNAKNRLVSQSCCQVHPLHPLPTPHVRSSCLAKAQAAGHRALPRELASTPKFQNRLLDAAARPAQDSLAPGPKLRSLENKAAQGLPGHSHTAQGHHDSVWSAPALSGGASALVELLPPWAAGLMIRNWRHLPHWPQLLLGTAVLVATAVPRHSPPRRARRTDSGKGTPPPLPFLAKAPGAHRSPAGPATLSTAGQRATGPESPAGPGPASQLLCTLRGAQSWTALAKSALTSPSRVLGA